MRTLTERLRACYTGAVHDVLRMMGHERVVLPPDLKPIDPTLKLAGPVWTVSGHIDRTKTRHETLLGWCTLLSKAPAGHVVVLQPHNREVAMMGELSAQTLAARGVLGFVVDGGSRDTELVLEQRFPVWCSFLTPSDIVERWIPDAYGAPVDMIASCTLHACSRFTARCSASPIVSPVISTPWLRMNSTLCWPSVFAIASHSARSSEMPWKS